MKLKGKNSERITGDKRKKMDETLKRMEETRVQDTLRLRTKVEEKTKELETNLKEADKLLENLNQKIKETKVTKNRIEGAIISLRDILK